MNLQLGAPQPLSVAHRLDDFACGEAVLDEWLKRRAMANQLSGASRSFVVPDRSNASTATTPWPQELSRIRWPRVQCAAICRTPCR
jgi:hypothetical protein